MTILSRRRKPTYPPPKSLYTAYAGLCRACLSLPVTKLRWNQPLRFAAVACGHGRSGARRRGALAPQPNHYFERLAQTQTPARRTRALARKILGAVFGHVARRKCFDESTFAL